jgi:hypothetical protein
MRNVFKVVGSVASAALLLSGAAMAAGPVGYAADGWTVNNTGVVSATCPVATCTVLAEGTGFKQIQFSSAGKTYIQTILAEGWASTGAAQAPSGLTFTDENLVQIGVGGVAAVQGLLSKTRIVEGAPPVLGVTGFGTTTDIATGWGTVSTANKAEVSIDLDISERPTGATTAANDFLSTFGFSGATTTGGTNVALSLDMDQTVMLDSVTDKQRFATTIKTAGALAAPSGGFKFAGNTTDSAKISWAATDRLQAIWIAQSVTGAGNGVGTAPFATSVLGNVTAKTAVRVTDLTSTKIATELDTGGSMTSIFSPGPVPKFNN